VTNAYGVPPEELGGQPSSRVVAQAFTGARLVKGFNHLAAAVLGQDPAVQGGRRVVFLASDDDGAPAEIGVLAEIRLRYIPYEFILNASISLLFEKCGLFLKMLPL